MNRNILRKILALGIVLSFIGIGVIPSFYAVSIEEETIVSKNSESNESFIAFLFGRIKNRTTEWYAEYFDAVNLYIMSLIPLRFYHLNSGEEVSITAINPDMYVIIGFLKDNFVIGLCMHVSW